MKERLVLIGEVVGVHGIRGEVKIRAHVEDEMLFSRDYPLFMEGGEQTSRSSPIPCQILRTRPHKSHLLAVVEGITTRNQAEALIGGKFYVEKSRLPEPETDVYYWHDLIGMTVQSAKGERYGEIASIIPTGANDVYVIQDEADNERLIPAIESVVLSVDVEERIMIIEMPEGL